MGRRSIRWDRPLPHCDVHDNEVFCKCVISDIAARGDEPLLGDEVYIVPLRSAPGVDAGGHFPCLLMRAEFDDTEPGSAIEIRFAPEYFWALPSHPIIVSTEPIHRLDVINAAVPYVVEAYYTHPCQCERIVFESLHDQHEIVYDMTYRLMSAYAKNPKPPYYCGDCDVSDLIPDVSRYPTAKSSATTYSSSSGASTTWTITNPTIGSVTRGNDFIINAT